MHVHALTFLPFRAMQVDHQIFALCRLDVTGDGSDEIVACAWDGQTYILDHQQNSVRFHFEEPVRAFCTGIYNVSAGISTPCLVYNTFNNKVTIFRPRKVQIPANTGSKHETLRDDVLADFSLLRRDASEYGD